MILDGAVLVETLVELEDRIRQMGTAGEWERRNWEGIHMAYDQTERLIAALNRVAAAMETRP